MYFDDFAATLSEGAGKFDGSEGSPNLKLAQEIFLKCPRIRIADPIAVLDKIEKELYKEFEDDHDLAHLPFEAFTISLPQATFIVSRGNGLCSRFVPESTFVYIEMAQSPEQRRVVVTDPVGVKTSGGQFLLQLYDRANNNPEVYDRAMRRGAALLIAALKISMLCGTRATLITVPEKLQRKRAKRGKYPNFEYWVLNVDAAAVQQAPTDQRLKIVDRQPPRTHKRRGHWRRRNNKLIAVKACDVAQKNASRFGRIIKDYEYV